MPGFFESFGLAADLLFPNWGIMGIDGAHHNMIQGNRISGVMADIVLLGSVTPFAVAEVFPPPTHENVVIGNPGQVIENLPDDPDPSFGNVLIGINPVEEESMALWQDLIQNVGPRTQSATEDFSNVFPVPDIIRHREHLKHSITQVLTRSIEC